MSAQGHLYGWGNTKDNRFGLSGEGINVPRLIPLKVQARAIAVGNWHSMFIDTDGKLWATGHNKQGACGTGSFDNLETFTPVKTEIQAR
jgi:alpha-tubulin suppressor-like RCC1 family protein